MLRGWPVSQASQLKLATNGVLFDIAASLRWSLTTHWIDRTGGHDLAQLRTIQDWFLKYELQTGDGVSEVATISGMVKQ